MAVLYGLLFGVLALMDFPLWQRLGFAGFSALVLGSWITDSVNDDLPMASSMQKLTSAIGYWCLYVVYWLAFMSALCLASTLILEIVSEVI